MDRPLQTETTMAAVEGMTPRAQLVDTNAAKQRWKRLLHDIRKRLHHRENAFPIERLQELNVLFLEDPSNPPEDLSRAQTIELDEAEFVKRFGAYLKGHFTPPQLLQWFVDIDVDLSGGVSWEEFTTYMIHHAMGTDAENTRNKEYVPNFFISQAHHEHKDSVRRLAYNEKTAQYVTAGYDGIVKTWAASTLQHVKTINNTKNSAGHREALSGTSIPVCPITDVVFSSGFHSTHVAAVDKSINVYDSMSMELTRRYIGRLMHNENGAERTYIGGGRGFSVDTITLMEMEDAASSVDVACVGDRETMFLGLQNGEMLAFPVSRHTHAHEVRPSMHCHHHEKAVSKLRYYRSLEALVSCSWDKTVRVTDAVTGAVISCLDGGMRGSERHKKSAFDFAYSVSSKILATAACERDIYLWNPLMDTPLTKLKGHSSLLLGVSFNELDNQLISLAQDNTIKVWDMRTHRCFQTLHSTDQFTELSTLLYDNTHHRIVAASSTPTSWNIRRSLSHFPPRHTGHTESVVSVSYVPENETLITTDSNTAMAWNINSGKRQLVWELNPTSVNPVVAVNLDTRKRRLLVASRDGRLSVYNHRNGQLLREISGATTSEPVGALHLANEEESSKLLATVSSTEATVSGEVGEVLLNKIDSVIYPRPGTGVFTCCCVYPAFGKSTTAAMVCGTSDGYVASFSVTTGTLNTCLRHPNEGEEGRRLSKSRVSSHSKRRPTTTHSTLTDFADAFSIRAVEDIVYLAKKDLFVTTLGETHLYFWDLRRFSLKFALDSRMEPEVCLLCVATDANNQHLISSDDQGFVYVRDISALPYNSPSMHITRDMMPITHTFKAYDEVPITRVVFVDHRNFIITLATDSFIKLFGLDGTFVGYFGQHEPWHLRKPATYNRLGGGATEYEDVPIPRERPPTPTFDTMVDFTDHGGSMLRSSFMTQVSDSGLGTGPGILQSSQKSPTRTPQRTPQRTPVSTPLTASNALTLGTFMTIPPLAVTKSTRSTPRSLPNLPPMDLGGSFQDTLQRLQQQREKEALSPLPTNKASTRSVQSSNVFDVDRSKGLRPALRIRERARKGGEMPSSIVRVPFNVTPLKESVILRKEVPVMSPRFHRLPTFELDGLNTAGSFMSPKLMRSKTQMSVAEFTVHMYNLKQLKEKEDRNFTVMHSPRKRKALASFATMKMEEDAGEQPSEFGGDNAPLADNGGGATGAPSLGNVSSLATSHSEGDGSHRAKESDRRNRDRKVVLPPIPMVQSMGASSSMAASSPPSSPTNGPTSSTSGGAVPVPARKSVVEQARKRDPMGWVNRTSSLMALQKVGKVVNPLRGAKKSVATYRPTQLFPGQGAFLPPPPPPPV